MAVSFLDFEQPIAELEAKIEELKLVTSASEAGIQDEIARLQAMRAELLERTFKRPSHRPMTQPPRHPQRP